jgi:hypothetical protein
VTGESRGAAAPEDEERYRQLAQELATAVELALEPWVVRTVEARCRDAGRIVDDEVRAAAHDAGRRCRDQVGAAVRELLSTDPDDQRGSPLALLRSATRFATEVLHQLGVSPVERDEFSVAAFAEDVYDLSPASFADVDPALHEPGLMWGAAKAHIHLARRRAEGRR